MSAIKAAPNNSSSVPTVDQLASKASEVSPLSLVAQRVIELLGREEVSYEDVTRIISRDPGLTLRILRQANSPFYGLSREVTSIGWAITLLGTQTVKSLVITAAFQNLFRRSGLAERLLWEHAVACAMGSKMMASQVEPRVSEMAFLGGLLHDLGKTVFNSTTPELYTQVMGECYENRVTFRSAEQALYGYTHAELGAGVLLRWQMPRELALVVRYHHLDQDHPLDEFMDPLTQKALHCVALTNAVCKRIPLGYKNASAEIDGPGVLSARKLGFSAEDLEDWQQRIYAIFQSEQMRFL